MSQANSQKVSSEMGWDALVTKGDVTHGQVIWNINVLPNAPCHLQGWLRPYRGITRRKLCCLCVSPLPWNPESETERGTKQVSAKFVLFHKPFLMLHSLHRAQLWSFLLWLTLKIYYHHQLVPNQELLCNKPLTVGTMNAKSCSVQEA